MSNDTVPPPLAGETKAAVNVDTKRLRELVKELLSSASEKRQTGLIPGDEFPNIEMAKGRMGGSPTFKNSRLNVGTIIWQLSHELTQEQLDYLHDGWPSSTSHIPEAMRYVAALLWSVDDNLIEVISSVPTLLDEHTALTAQVEAMQSIWDDAVNLHPQLEQKFPDWPAATARDIVPATGSAGGAGEAKLPKRDTVRLPERIRVTGARMPGLWYENRIGEEFDVIDMFMEDPQDAYAVDRTDPAAQGYGWIVWCTDCEPVSDAEATQ